MLGGVAKAEVGVYVVVVVEVVVVVVDIVGGALKVGIDCPGISGRGS